MIYNNQIANQRSAFLIKHIFSLLLFPEMMMYKCIYLHTQKKNRNLREISPGGKHSKDIRFTLCLWNIETTVFENSPGECYH